MKTKKIKKQRSVREWPMDWDCHILRTSELYFDHRPILPIEFINGVSQYTAIVLPEDFTDQQDAEEAVMRKLRLEGIMLRTLQEVNRRYYTAWFSWDSDMIVGAVYWNQEELSDLSRLPPLPVNQIILPVLDHSFWISEAVRSFRATSAFECVEKIEKIIIDHYSGPDDKGGWSDPVDSPDPVNSLDLDTVLS